MMMAVGGLVVGLVAGAALTAAAAALWAPRMMFHTEASPRGFDETVAALEESLAAEGWGSPGTIDLQAAMAKKGVDFRRRVKVVQLCKPEYADEVLTADSTMSAMMPCAISVWEDDSGQVHVSKLNTGLMARLFGGVVGEVMGGRVAPEEAAILARALNSGA
jgi:uncharacterized protein (DUF302 family)